MKKSQLAGIIYLYLNILNFVLIYEPPQGFGGFTLSTFSLVSIDTIYIRIKKKLIKFKSVNLF